MSGVSWRLEGQAALVTLSQADENRFSGPFLAEVRDLFGELSRNETVRAVVITGGHEKYFCNGLDLNWMAAQDPPTLTAFLTDISQLLKDTALFGKPLIGAINGHTFGLGCIWASGFDFRIMREDRGWACFPEMDINIPFLPGMIALCEHGLGIRAFREMAWSAKRYTGPEAVAVGWANAAVPRDQLLPRALELAAFMAQKAQPAFALTKQRWAARVVNVIETQDPPAIRSVILPKK